ncbi:TPA: phytanoyl-CoA dioxygenase family protein [Legionella pneumophila]|uniref:phytanoyl-CoA dioxygenase family protein n=1 Tax=Legionella pneumophila TaxID=446 RepID=UPI000481309B|nr:phytanoyl-CoA dioxygenase family protein [Legionella pneumophila]MDW8987921.1 phytanoyl-CoA dioxygenase family protein [Legionella pneumophila]MDW8993571.1 phytanoyl-CoA dioxygenase family protein [Legionella pneumophila]MDW8999987.1 phytanoyl-CoA dioxygenase family protein [Legionella pneumophila]MDW9002977.1 phytanoyl-CoA dioxygenase family protein [Legionella pneumophila]HAT1970586.1 hypothetical protein [Legionella pneumophila]
MNSGDLELQALKRDGYIVLSGILSADEIEQARQEFERWFQQDIESRQQNNINDPHYPNGPFGYTILTEASHLALNVYSKSECFDKLVDKVLSHDKIQQIIKAWNGPGYKVSGINLRFMTGAFDPPPAHELHRDHPGSMNLGIMLTDVEPGNNGATALVPGSQWSNVDPRWDCLFQKPFRLKKDPSKNGIDLFLKINIFNFLFKKKSLKKMTGAFGKKGDVYFFANGEVWHGRLPNLHGQRAMICLIGVHPVDEESINTGSQIPPEILAKLPSNLAKNLNGPFEINNPENSIREHIYSNRKRLSIFSLAYWSKLERRFAEWISARKIK